MNSKHNKHNNDDTGSSNCTFLRGLCGGFAETLRRLPYFSQGADQEVLQRLTETTNPRKSCAETSKSKLVKFPTPGRGWVRCVVCLIPGSENPGMYVSPED